MHCGRDDAAPCWCAALSVDPQRLAALARELRGCVCPDCLAAVAAGAEPAANSEPALHTLYAQEGGVTQVFTQKVADYAASRPDYPEALFARWRDDGVLPPGTRVADVGAGTGLLTDGLLRHGARVTAIEPDPAMRAAADARLGRRAGYRSLPGRAEAMPLDDGSVDLVTAAQAFHWFDIDAARRECLRVLAPAGQVALVWNDRVLDDPLHAALDDLFAEFGGARRGALLAHEDRSQVPRFFGAGAGDDGWREYRLPHRHTLDAAGLASLVFSRSYMPLRDSADGRRVLSRMGGMVEAHAPDGRVVVAYTTVACVGRPRPTGP